LFRYEKNVIHKSDADVNCRNLHTKYFQKINLDLQVQARFWLIEGVFSGKKITSPIGMSQKMYWFE